jgi:hypothetical protein
VTDAWRMRAPSALLSELDGVCDLSNADLG